MWLEIRKFAPSQSSSPAHFRIAALAKLPEQIEHFGRNVFGQSGVIDAVQRDAERIGARRFAAHLSVPPAATASCGALAFLLRWQGQIIHPSRRMPPNVPSLSEKPRYRPSR